MQRVVWFVLGALSASVVWLLVLRAGQLTLLNQILGSG